MACLEATSAIPASAREARDELLRDLVRIARALSRRWLDHTRGRPRRGGGHRSDAIYSHRIGVGDDHPVEPAEHLVGARHGRAHGLLVARIGHDVARLPASIRDLAHRLAHEPLDGPGDHDADASCGEGEGDRTAEGSSTIRDESDLFGEGHAARLTQERRRRYTDVVPDEPSPERDRKRKKVISRVVYGLYVGVAGAFIVSSTVQITLAVFKTEPADKGDARSAVTPACAAGVKELAGAVDRAFAAAVVGRDPIDATRRYREARSPEWDDPRRSELLAPCSDATGGAAAAAVARFDQAAEGAASAGGARAAELGTVRRTVDSFIR